MKTAEVHRQQVQGPSCDMYLVGMQPRVLSCALKTWHVQPRARRAG